MVSGPWLNVRHDQQYGQVECQPPKRPHFSPVEHRVRSRQNPPKTACEKERGSDTEIIMKAYLITTGSLFALIALMHLLKAIADWHNVTANPGEYFSMAALGLVALAISLWALRLLRLAKR